MPSIEKVCAELIRREAAGSGRQAKEIMSAVAGLLRAQPVPQGAGMEQIGQVRTSTLHPWIESQGFVAGKNEPCVLYNEKTGVLVKTYVDDCQGDGPTAEVEKFMTALAVRFKCKPPVRFGIGSPIDHLGMTIFETRRVCI